jgi:hypothetical protein
MIGKPFFPFEKGEGNKLADEAFGWLFVGGTPLLFEKRRVARQFQIETWLDLAQVLKELGIENTPKNERSLNQASYIV